MKNEKVKRRNELQVNENNARAKVWGKNQPGEMCRIWHVVSITLFTCSMASEITGSIFTLDRDWSSSDLISARKSKLSSNLGSKEKSSSTCRSSG